MNLEALRFILINQEELLRQKARESGREEDTVVGIARLTIAEGGIAKLSTHQLFNFNSAILPLIHDVPCTAFTSELEDEPNICHNILLDDDLLKCYQDDNFLCENCQDAASDYYAQKQSWEWNNRD